MELNTDEPNNLLAPARYTAGLKTVVFPEDSAYYVGTAKGYTSSLEGDTPRWFQYVLTYCVVSVLVILFVPVVVLLGLGQLWENLLKKAGCR